jgi:pseudaminic acid biosynthesis-associated methylase
MADTSPHSDAQRLEGLWSGEFGSQYIERNVDAGAKREPFWRELLADVEVRRVLEVGCNIGANLRWLAQLLEPREVFGVDVSEEALARLRQTIPTINAVHSPARHLPFRDGEFDLVYTTGVLIHLPPDTLPLAMSEIVRCSRRYVLCGEYYAEELTEVPYRGQEGALFKRDWGATYQQLFPELRLLRTGFLGSDQGWDDVTWWLFERG